MIKGLKNKLKNENGAISAFALMSMVFFLIFIVSIFVFFTRRSQTQAETLRLLADKYNGKTEDDIVSTLVSNEADIIPIYTLEQLYEIGSDKYITVPQENGKIYKHSYKEDANTADEIDDRAMYKLMNNWSLDELTDVLLQVIANHPENTDGFVDLDTNQAKGMYIVNFPNIARGKLAVNKTIKKSDAAGFYYGADSEIIYQIEIINDGEIDVDNIEVVDTIRKLIDGESAITTENLKVYTDEACTTEYTPYFTLKTTIQEDGSVIDHEQHEASKDCDICEFLYVKYVTSPEDVQNKHILENYVEVKGDSDGVTARANDTSPKISFATAPDYHKENLIIWYDGIDNEAEAGSESTLKKDGDPESTAEKWFDKTTPQTNADVGNNNNWENGIYYKIEDENDIIEFSGTSELVDFVEELDTNTSEDFTIQIVFKSNGNSGTLYSFGRINNNTRAMKIMINNRGYITFYSEEGGTTNLTGLGTVQKDVPYVLTIKGTFKYYDTKRENSGGGGRKPRPGANQYYVDYYSLECEAYLDNINTLVQTPANAIIRPITQIRRDQYDYDNEENNANVIFGFDYNLLGSEWETWSANGTVNEDEVLESNIYAYRLYDKKLTLDEIDNNVSADIYRFFR